MAGGVGPVWSWASPRVVAMRAVSHSRLVGAAAPAEIASLVDKGEPPVARIVPRIELAFLELPPSAQPELEGAHLSHTSLRIGRITPRGTTALASDCQDKEPKRF